MFQLDLSFLVESVLIFALAFLIDVVFGEIPDRAHPTVWMGKVIAYLKPRIRSVNSKVEKANGVLLCVWVIALFAVPVVFPVSYTHLRAHETGRNLVCRLLLEK